MVLMKQCIEIHAVAHLASESGISEVCITVEKFESISIGNVMGKNYKQEKNHYSPTSTEL
jgi:hypothetical protein